jgi:hypothetical protein
MLDAGYSILDKQAKTVFFRLEEEQNEQKVIKNGQKSAFYEHI